MRLVKRLLIPAAMVLACGAAGMSQDLPLAPPGDGDVEVLTQGPIHEAFANPTNLDPTVPPVVSRQPPPEIQEEPPEFMPEDAIWIGGYWQWDDERSDFIWVSGVARQQPPGMRFVAGYWTEVPGGWQRVSGFWTSGDAAEVVYRPVPPNSLEAGPSSPAPADNYFWVPGSWSYYETGYRWRTGYWSPYRPDWVWVPARWIWTPGGCVYLPGFWDLRLALRGQIFAPVCFQRPVYLQPRYVYRPWCAIPTTNLFIHLWIRPSHGHYYFGNYYGPRYASRGFQPWCSAASRPHCYDPLLTHTTVHYRQQGVDFVGRVQNWHDYYDKHEDQRPPRTWHEQVVQQKQPSKQVATQLIARPIAEVAKDNDTPLRLTKLDAQARQAIVQRTQKQHEINVSRQAVEHKAFEQKAIEHKTVERKTISPPTASAAIANLPKLKLPQEPVVKPTKIAERTPPTGRGRNSGGDNNKPVGPARVTPIVRDNIPPPMPGGSDDKPEPRGKGRADRTVTPKVEIAPKIESPDVSPRIAPPLNLPVRPLAKSPLASDGGKSNAKTKSDKPLKKPESKANKGQGRQD